jgi:hypothetical protein
MHGQPARNQILVGSSLRQRVSIGIILNQCAASDKFPQQRVKFPALRAMQPKLAHQLLDPGRAFRLSWS